jgi:hypothetical protein
MISTRLHKFARIEIKFEFKFKLETKIIYIYIYISNSNNSGPVSWKETGRATKNSKAHKGTWFKPWPMEAHGC